MDATAEPCTASSSHSPKRMLFSKCYRAKDNNKGRSIVFVHGGPGANSWAFENSMARRLARRGYDVVVYDQYGCGRSRKYGNEPTVHSVCNAIEDLHKVITEDRKLESPILLGHSWGGFLSLRFLDKYPELVKGVVIVCSPIDYPESFYNILTRVHDLYDRVRSLLRMKAFPRMREVEALKDRMFPLRLTEGVMTRRPDLRRGKRKDTDADKGYDFDGYDVATVFEHARMLDFSAPINLVINPTYRSLTERLASQPDSEWFLDMDEGIGGHFFDNENCKVETPACLLERNNIDLIKEHRPKIHAIYCDKDRMFSKRQVEHIREELPARHFSYIYGAGHYPFLEQDDQFLEVLTKHLERMQRST